MFVLAGLLVAGTQQGGSPNCVAAAVLFSATHWQSYKEPFLYTPGNEHLVLKQSECCVTVSSLLCTCSITRQLHSRVSVKKQAIELSLPTDHQYKARVHQQVAKWVTSGQAHRSHPTCNVVFLVTGTGLAKKFIWY